MNLLQEEIDKINSSQFNGFLHKPIDFNILNNILKENLSMLNSIDEYQLSPDVDQEKLKSLIESFGNSGSLKVAKEIVKLLDNNSTLANELSSYIESFDVDKIEHTLQNLVIRHKGIFINK